MKSGYKLRLNICLATTSFATRGFAPAIALTESALKQLNAMRFKKNEDLYVRIDIKQGGCSGLSYTMEFEEKQSLRPIDCAIEYDGFVISMSFILFLFTIWHDLNICLIYIFRVTSHISLLFDCAVSDPESLAILRGVQLDYVDSLVGGWF